MARTIERKEENTMHSLTIYRRFFLSSDCFRSAPTQRVQGVQVHSTGANNPWLRRYVQPDDGRLGKNLSGNSHNRPGVTVCASAYIGKQADGQVAVYQALPWTQRCWLSGSGAKGNANRQGFIGFEICEDSGRDAAYFHAAMRQAVLLTAYLCTVYQLDPDACVRDHHELHGMGLASNHADITQWLSLYGKTMDDFRRAVKNIIIEGICANYVDTDREEETHLETKHQAVVTAANGYSVKVRALPGQHAAVIDKLAVGTVVTVTETVNEGWAHIAYEDQSGFMMRQFLTRASESEAKPGDEFICIVRSDLLAVEACLSDCLGKIRRAMQ